MTDTMDTNPQDFLTTADGEPHPSLPPLQLERGSDLGALLGLLNDQASVKYDVVVAADRLRYEDGALKISGALADNPVLSEDGVTTELSLAPTSIFEDQIAGRLDIPQRYVRRIREESRTDEYGTMLSLLDRNVNGWLHMAPARLFTVRGFYNPETGDGIARSIMSGRYEVVDHLDQLQAVLEGLKKVSEVNPLVDPSSLSWKVDLTERNMRVRLIAPQVNIHAPTLLAGYRDPWAGRYGGSTGDVPPILEAGLDIRNSETGGGAWVLIPFAHVLACSNGLVRKHEALRRVHLGTEKLEGQISYSVDTQRKVMAAVTSQTADAVAQFLTTGWLESVVDDITETATTKVEDAKGTLEVVAKAHKIGDEERDAIFELFLTAGQRTAGGVAQAITAHAHTASPTRAMELDDLALDAMTTAARYAMSN